MGTLTFCMQENGRLPDGIRESLSKLFPTYAGKKLSLSIHEAAEKRSLQANAYYWAAIVPHVRQVRFDNGDPVSEAQAHEDLLEEFALRVECKKLDGTPYMRPMRSKEMSVKQMAEYITAITACMAAFGNPVPITENQWRAN